MLAGSDSEQQRSTQQPIHCEQHPAADGGPQLIVEDILFCVFYLTFESVASAEELDIMSIYCPHLRPICCVPPPPADAALLRVVEM